MKWLLIMIVIGIAFLIFRMLSKSQFFHLKSMTFKPFKDAIQPKVAHSVISAKVEPLALSDEEQQLFDDVAQLFFQQNIQQHHIEHAEQIQQQFLSKMPIKTDSQIGEFDLGEWCIYWNYRSQSLEYYVGKYGIFYTHVDRHGVEHKADFKTIS